jgi:hypothetical protein
MRSDRQIELAAIEKVKNFQRAVRAKIERGAILPMRAAKILTITTAE